MKKGLSLLLCVLLIAASAAVIGIVPLNASANSVTNDSFSLDFENGSTPFDGTAMWSDATVQEFSSNAVSGNKSLYLEAEGDWCYLAVQNANIIQLEPNALYRFSFKYKLEAPSPFSMQIVLNDTAPSRNAVLDAVNGAMWSGDPDLISPDNTVITKNGDHFTLDMIFQTKASGEKWLCIQACWIPEKLKIYFDDIILEKLSTSESETFEKANSLKETLYTTEAVHSEITENTLFGGKALHVNNEELSPWTAFLKSNPARFKMESNTVYQLSFRYRISNRLDMVNIQLELTDNNGVMHRYTRFEPDTYKFGENNDYWLGGNSHFTADENGVVTARFVFKTSGDEKETQFKLIGDCWGLDVDNIWLDDISICKSPLSFGKVQDSFVITTAESLKDVEAVGCEIAGNGNLVCSETDYVNEFVQSNDYFILSKGNVYYADFNSDGTVDSSDLIYFRKLLLGIEVLNKNFKDINGDRNFDICDLIVFKKSLADKTVIDLDEYGIDYVYPFSIGSATGGDQIIVSPYAVIKGIKVYGLVGLA